MKTAQEVEKEIKLKLLQEIFDEAICSGDDNLNIRTIGISTELFNKLRAEYED